MATAGKMILLAMLSVAAVMAVSEQHPALTVLSELQELTNNWGPHACAMQISSCLEKLKLLPENSLTSKLDKFKADPCCNDFTSRTTATECICDFRDTLTHVFGTTGFCIADDRACPKKN